jgi:hypothetical protein
MSTSSEVIQVIATGVIEQLQSMLKNGVSSPRTHLIDCADLADYSDVDIRESEEFQVLFDELEQVKGPALYWFELVSDHEAAAIISALNTYKQADKPRATPALRNTQASTSRILYVGKVKRNLWGRLIQHMGFYRVAATQGLQLFHWAKKAGVSLKFNYIVFDNEMADIMPLIEYAFAKHYHPLVGKHY